MECTVQQLFNITIGVMGDQISNSTGYKENFLPILNTVLSECLDNENALRQRDGLEELTEAPYMEAWDTVIPYHTELVRNVLPYGIGMFLFLGDDENVKATFFSSKYDEHRNKFTPALYVETEAVF
ncbi:MAG: hypothetical protein J6K99_07250 [Peptococcaceae bacterium]|nr:hypothetical protein [Peptococcaceae bacterium]